MTTIMVRNSNGDEVPLELDIDTEDPTLNEYLGIVQQQRNDACEHTNMLIKCQELCRTCPIKIAQLRQLLFKYHIHKYEYYPKLLIKLTNFFVSIGKDCNKYDIEIIEWFFKTVEDIFADKTKLTYVEIMTTLDVMVGTKTQTEEYKLSKFGLSTSSYKKWKQSWSEFNPDISNHVKYHSWYFTMNKQRVMVNV